MTQAKVSSTMADEDLIELKTLKVGNGEGWVSFTIHSVARYNELNSRSSSLSISTFAVATCADQ